MRRLILRNFQSPGDVVMLTAAVRDLHRAYPGEFATDVRTACPDIWRNNPNFTPLSDNAPGVEVIDCHYPLIHESNQAPWHFLHGFIDFLNRRLSLSIRPTAFRGDIHLAEDEKCPSAFPALSELGATPYWIVVAGGKKDFTIKWWSSGRYQQVVDHFRGRLQFVQVGEGGHVHPALDGVIDLRGQTSLRELIRLVFRSSGVLSPVSLLMHLAAAVDYPGADPGARPCVVVAGGREPPHWEAYPTHQFLHTVGMLPCCRSGGCWRSRTRPLGDGEEHDAPQHLCLDVDGDLPRCMAMIRPEHVIDRIEAYLQNQQPVASIQRAGSRAVFKPAWSFSQQPSTQQTPAQQTPTQQTPAQQTPTQDEPRRETCPVTICVLTYGDYFRLATASIESILENCERSSYRLVVGANAVAPETRQYLEQLSASGRIDRLSISDSNLHKGPMMRRMFDGVETEFIWWFDDDSYIVDRDAMPRRLEIARGAAASVAIWGHVFFFSHERDFNDSSNVTEFVKASPWYRGKEPPHWSRGGKGEFDFEGRGTGDGRWFFVTGGCWLARTQALRALDWPDVRMNRRYDDVLLCEALRQQGWQMEDIGPCGVAINTQPRRGPG